VDAIKINSLRAKSAFFALVPPVSDRVARNQLATRFAHTRIASLRSQSACVQLVSASVASARSGSARFSSPQLQRYWKSAHNTLALLLKVESLHSQSTCLAGNQLASGSLCSRSARRFSSATSLRLLAACFAAMKQLAARFACIRFVSTRIAALAIILLCSQAARSLLRSH
jgi:hypothetical protein